MKAGFSKTWKALLSWPKPPGERYAACEFCDTLHEAGTLEEGAAARCIRCGTVLYQNRMASLTRASACALAALILMALAHVFPFLTMDAATLRKSLTLLGAAVALIDGVRLLRERRFRKLPPLLIFNIGMPLAGAGQFALIAGQAGAAGGAVAGAIGPPTSIATTSCLTMGGSGGGLTCYMDQGHLLFEYNLMIIDRSIAKSADKIAPGKHTIVVTTTLKAPKPGAPADIVLTVDGKEADTVLAALGLLHNRVKCVIPEEYGGIIGWR